MTTALQTRVCTITAGTLQIDGARVRVDVERSLKKDPNKCVIEITGLSAASRAKLQTAWMPIDVTAGYSDNSGVIFSGDATLVASFREGTEWTTKITCGDGARKYLHARANESFGAGHPLSDAIKKVAAQLGAEGNVSNAVAGLVDRLTHGFAASGPASTALDTLARKAGLTWSSQGGSIQLINATDPVQPDRVALLTPDTGLLGSPETVAPEKAGAAPTIKIKCRMDPRLRPGYVVAVDSRAVSGQFRILKLQHKGDTHGAEWMTELECTS
jgi:hypothetical protein